MKNFTKNLVIILIILIVFETIFSSTINAEVFTFDDALAEGAINAGVSLAGGIVSWNIWVPKLLLIIATTVVNVITRGIIITGGIPDNSIFNGTSVFLTPFDIFFGNYPIIDVNFFRLDGFKPDSFVYKFRSSVAYWFYALRNISVVIASVELVYVGIRMAMASAAEQKAKYKKMMYDWVCSVILIFVLQYLAISIIYVNEAIVKSVSVIIRNSTSDSINEIIYSFLKYGLTFGITSIVSAAIFVIITGQTIFYFIAYLNRMLKIGFLVIISPLISITYTLDKIKDGKAQALNSWLKEFVYTILIQPFHCIIYITLVDVAFRLTTHASTGSFLGIFEMNMVSSGVLAILCLKFITDGEKVIRKIFGFADDNSKTSLIAGAALTMAAIKNAKKIGKTARMGVNLTKKSGAVFKQAVSKDMSKFKASKLYENAGVQKSLKALGSTKNAVANKYNGVKSAVSNSIVGKAGRYGMNKASGLKNRTINGYKKFAEKHGFVGKAGQYVKEKFKDGTKSMSQVLGTMAGLMSYATGDTTLMSANAYRQAVGDGLGEFFYTSEKNIANSQSDTHQAMEEYSKDQAEKNYAKIKDKLDEERDRLGFDEDVTTDDINEINKQKQEKIKELEEQNAKKTKILNDKSTEKHRKRELSSDIEKNKDEIKQLQEEMQELNGLSKLLAVKEELDNFYTLEAIAERTATYSHSAKGSTIETAKLNMIQLMNQILMKRKKNAGVKDFNDVTDDESELTQKTFDVFNKYVDYSIANGKADRPDITMFVKDYTDDGISEEMEQLIGFAQQYEFLRRKKEFASSIRKADNLEINRDDLIDRIAKNALGEENRVENGLHQRRQRYS